MEVLSSVNKLLENLVKHVTFEKMASGIEQSNPHTSLFPFKKVTLFSHVQDEEGVVHTPPRTPPPPLSFPQLQLWPLTILLRGNFYSGCFSSSAWTPTERQIGQNQVSSLYICLSVLLVFLATSVSIHLSLSLLSACLSVCHLPNSTSILALPAFCLSPVLATFLFP